MEADSEMENMLAQQMSCMVTNDKEALVRQFQQILGDSTIAAETCAFFLDMSNWNLPAALGAFYDYGISNNAHLMSNAINMGQLNMGLVKDVTIGEGESVAPRTKFVKTWRVKNTGVVAWPEGCMLCCMEGTRMSFGDNIQMPQLKPGEEMEINAPMEAPGSPGMYQSRWQLNTAVRVPFGESIWCIVMVDQMGILDITQQLASAPLNDRPAETSSNFNPFNFAVPNAPHEQFDRRSQEADGVNDLTHNMATINCFGGSPHVPHSQPMTILRGDVPEGPPCTPCTPPNSVNNTWNGPPGPGNNGPNGMN